MPAMETRTVTISNSAWTELMTTFHPADRYVTHVEGEPALVVRVGMTGRVVRIVRGKV